MSVAVFTATLFTPLVDGPTLGVLTARTPEDLRPKGMTAVITARIWDVATGRQVARLQGANTAVHDAQFSPDGRWLITAASKTGLWDVGDRELMLRLQGHEGTTTSAVFDPSGTVVFTGGDDGAVRRYECRICGGVNDLLALADRRLVGTGRVMSGEERERYFG